MPKDDAETTALKKELNDLIAKVKVCTVGNALYPTYLIN